ncbi:hypothetical protein NPIL_543221 [Nephila pilipes]|uniref:Uncharacterized protein n=1 Tax=Nephila pilipes TaxID=299642 RepID=A0A8X6U9K3_NEPPI|nr:hypothetical protein NPIL_543221 [Nephila pilipes]
MHGGFGDSNKMLTSLVRSVHDLDQNASSTQVVRPTRFWSVSVPEETCNLDADSSTAGELDAPRPGHDSTEDEAAVRLQQPRTSAVSKVRGRDIINHERRSKQPMRGKGVLDSSRWRERICQRKQPSKRKGRSRKEGNLKFDHPHGERCSILFQYLAIMTTCPLEACGSGRASNKDTPSFPTAARGR